jgi:membrane-associated phospholipid phosphatase
MSATFIRRLLETDASLTARLNVSGRAGRVRRTLAFLAHSGDSWFMIPVMGIIWLLGDSTWKWRMVIMVIAICITALVAVGLKFVIRRQRPAGDWGLVYRSTDPHSFPSGHAARLTMLAILSLHTGPAWFAVALCVWAPLVALARVGMGVHYITDVLGGAVLGIAFGLLFICIF